MNNPVVISPIVRYWCEDGTSVLNDGTNILIWGKDFNAAVWLSEYMEYGAETYGWREGGRGRIEHLNLN